MRDQQNNFATQRGQSIQIDLPNGRRCVVRRGVCDIEDTPQGKIGFTRLGMDWHRVRLIPTAQEWRIVDPAYRYKKVEFRVSGKRVYEVV